MPLSPLQRQILATIAAQRNPESYVAGGTALHRDGIRGSDDIDIFHDREERLDAAVEADTAALTSAGFQLDWERRAPAIHRARVSSGADATRLEWVVDSEFRFFPTMADLEFGYVLHPLDLATNKLLAAAGRFE